MSQPELGRLPRLQQWRDAGRHFPFAGHEIFIRDSGGPPGARVLLLLHGFPTSSFDWHLIQERLARRFRVVAADMLGFGFSAKPRGARYSIFTQADLFEELASHLAVSDVHLLAHDYGDTVAQEMLARYEERRASNSTDARALRIHSICLLNGGLFPETHRALLIQKMLASRAGPLIARLMSERRFRKTLAAIFGPESKPTAEELAEYWAVVSERDGQLLFPKLIGYIAERRQNRERWVGALRNASVPIRLIDGLADPISGAHMVELYRELIPRPDIVELPGIGHYPQHEAPDAVLDGVMEFHDRLET
jgi:pimeloyl-ACP methyl ester carboxylesterase